MANQYVMMRDITYFNQIRNPIVCLLNLYLVFCRYHETKLTRMHQEDSRTSRNRKEDKELIQSIVFFALVALVVAALLIKGSL